MKILALCAALTCAFAASGLNAQPMPPPGGHRGVPAAEALATLPNVSAAQQSEIRKILLQRRDAEEAAQTRAHAEFDALRIKQRNEHERLDQQASDQLRKLLGDDGYQNYARWDLAQRGPGGMGRGGPRHEHGERDGRDNRDNSPPSPAGMDTHAPTPPERPAQQ